MEFKYVRGRPATRPEQDAVAAGWKWVRTNTIVATLHHKDINFANPDRLLPHSHHGENTHIIVDGDLCIMSTEGGKSNKSEISTAAEAKKELIVNPNVAYRGTSRRGCSFVEGHRALSPATAERFIDRGTLRAVELQPGSCPLPEEWQLKKWLREATFYPDGKAYPNYAKGEKPILQYRDHPVSAKEIRAQKEISKWFEKEWKPMGWPKYLAITTMVFFKKFVITIMLVVAFQIMILFYMSTNVNGFSRDL
ncbi:hypothetical protein F5B20DRAFT_581616 [Whalleya microplaca]|nr:hypothetical protein F5B20DRAFT_581616 [Whalleya microplaca]